MLRGLIVVRLALAGCALAGCDKKEPPAPVIAESPELPAPPLEPLAPMGSPTEPRVPGSSAYPAMFVELAEPIEAGRAIAAYEATFDEFGGLAGWAIMAQRDGDWVTLPHGLRHEDSVQRLSCGVDLLADPARPSRAVMLNLRTIRRACPWLARHAGGEASGTVDQEAALAKADEVRDAVESHAHFEVRLVRDFPVSMENVHELVQGLGFVRSDLRTFEWRDTLRLHVDGDGVDTEEIRSMELAVQLKVLPEIAAQRFESTLNTLREALDLQIEQQGGSVSSEALRVRLTESVRVMRDLGYARS